MHILLIEISEGSINTTANFSEFCEFKADSYLLKTHGDIFSQLINKMNPPINSLQLPSLYSALFVCLVMILPESGINSQIFSIH